MIERDLKKIELENGRIPFDEWFETLGDNHLQAAVTKAVNRRTSSGQSGCGSNGRRVIKVRLRNYQDDLIERLKDPKYAAAYLAQVLEDGDQSAFLIALKDVVEAGGGMGVLAGRVDIKRPSLYRILSKKGNPTLATLQDILRPLGLQVSITPLVRAA